MNFVSIQKLESKSIELRKESILKFLCISHLEIYIPKDLISLIQYVFSKIFRDLYASNMTFDFCQAGIVMGCSCGIISNWSSHNFMRPFTHDGPIIKCKECKCSISHSHQDCHMCPHLWLIITEKYFSIKPICNIQPFMH
jgi:hypothetical protein